MERKSTDLDRTEPKGTGILPVRFPLALPIPPTLIVNTVVARNASISMP